MAAAASALSSADIKERADEIKRDAVWFTRLYMRWTVAYWFLTLCAAGTAVSAAVKSAYTSNHSGAGNTAVPGFDSWVIALAAVTVVATVLQGVMRADQLAERYRYGDLLLKMEILRFDGSDRTKADLDLLVAASIRAHQILQGAIAPTVVAGAAAAPTAGTVRTGG